MRIIDKGHGTPIVLVPGIQGRWEYFGGLVEALAQSHRVITFSLCDEPGWQPESAGVPAPGLDQFVDQIDAALADRGLTKAIVCGVSFGGLAALRFAARRPERIIALVLASVPGPGWRLKRSHRRYVRHPRVSTPLFLIGVPVRLSGEIAAAIPAAGERRRFTGELLRMLLRWPLSPSRMAARARLIDGVDNAADCARIETPTLLLTGEPGLDHVVSADATSAYATLIPGALVAVLERTGHLGSITRPDAFAEAIRRFLIRAGVTAQPGEHAA